MSLPVRIGVAAATVVATLIAGCSSATVTAPTTTPARASASSTGRSAGSSGLATCPLSGLPAQANAVVGDIHRGGPFDYPSNDNVVFGNREGVLPQQSRSYYHEYTVPTPGSRTRGARRIVTGGKPLTDPPVYFYTGDHYATFCEVTGATR